MSRYINVGREENRVVVFELAVDIAELVFYGTVILYIVRRWRK